MRLVFLFATLCVFFGACKPSPKAKSGSLQLTELQKASLVRAAEFLASLQRSDGSITIGTHETSDSVIGQTGYALRALALVESEFGGYEKQITAGREYVLRRAQKDGLYKYKDFLPADLDDTTAALAALGRLDRRETVAIEKAIDTILRLQSADGGLRTWLLSDAEFKRMGIDASKLRLAEAHAEVMAYFFEFLHSFAAERYEKNIDLAAAYIVKQQDKTGAWKTTWYRSEFYAMNRVLRFLTSVPRLNQKYYAQIGRALAYVQKNMKNKVGVLDTAFSIGMLCAAAAKAKEQLDTQTTRLISLQGASGDWHAEPFFFLDINQRDKKPEEIIYIESELYSTALAIENLMLSYRARAINR